MTRRWLAIAGVTLPGLILMAIGISHPVRLTTETADWWSTMHMILVPVFPLLTVAVWVLLRHDASPLGWAGRIAAVVYAVFYGTLDTVSGISTGVIVRATGEKAGTGALFDVGTVFGRIGSIALLAAIIIVLGSFFMAGVRGVFFWGAGLVLLASGLGFMMRHIYLPVGAASMLGLAVGFLTLELLRQRMDAATTARAVPATR